MNLTNAQKKLARHALGLPNDMRRSYRNRYRAAVDGPITGEWRKMVEAGLATCQPVKDSQLGDFFYLTPAGAQLALEAGEKLCPEDFPATTS
jgi:hypothetical protein